MNPPLFRVRTRVLNGVGGSVVRVRIYERIEGTPTEGLSANSFFIDLQCLPALVPALQCVLEQATQDGDFVDDDGRPYVPGGRNG
jgi:hypothetical protein